MQNRMNPAVTQQQMDKQENLELRMNVTLQHPLEIPVTVQITPEIRQFKAEM